MDKYRLARMLRIFEQQGSGLVAGEPVYMTDLIITGAVEDNALVVIRDGFSSSATEIIYINSLNLTTVHYRFDPPLYFREALYHHRGSGSYRTMIRYITEKDYENAIRCEPNNPAQYYSELTGRSKADIT